MILLWNRRVFKLYEINSGLGVKVRVLNATFNNISVISWRSVWLVEETEVPEENHWPVTIQGQTLSQSCIEYTSPWAGFEHTTVVAMGIDCTCSCKSNNHNITTSIGKVYKGIWIWLPCKEQSLGLLTYGHNGTLQIHIWSQLQQNLEFRRFWNNFCVFVR
jgi:hypothetical protein